MTDAAPHTRRFRVHTRHVDHHHARMVEEVSFEAAAIAYLEHFEAPAPNGEDRAVSVIVRDVGNGHEHCFRLDLESGETSPCT